MTDKAPVKEDKITAFFKDMALGGSIGAVSKTVMSPGERVKILMQTMDSNPKVISGEVKPYSGAFAFACGLPWPVADFPF